MKDISQAAIRMVLRVLGLAAVVVYACFGGGYQVGAREAAGDASFTGQFSILYGDGPGGQTHTQYFLHNTDGRILLLELGEETIRAAGGTLALDRRQVLIRGSMMTSREGPEQLRVSAISALGDQDPQAVTGSHPWISIMCKFNDVSAEPKDLAYFQNMYSSAWPGLDHYWREVSFDLANVSGSGAVGWYTLPQPRSYYVYNNALDFGRAANDCTAVADADVNFANYDGINLMFNDHLDGYAWGGKWHLTLDGVTQYWNMTWEPPWGYSSITVMSHEMGHGFGLPHSSGMYGETYDNRWDVMSDTWTDCANSTDPTYGCIGQHTISYHKDMLGWITLPERYIPPAAGGTHTITLEQLALPATGNYKMAKIPIGISLTHFYTVEVRRKVGYDVKLPGQAVIIHEVDTTRSRPANVVDPDNNGNTGDDGAMWLPGETFTDTANHITVTVLAATATGFEVSITTTGMAPSAFNKTSPSNGSLSQPANPTLSWAASNGALTYEYCYDTINDNACNGAWTNVGTNTSAGLSGLTTGMYYWQVRANNLIGSTYANGSSTAWWWFYVLDKPLAFNKTSPTNGAGGLPSNPTLTWGASTGASSYSYCYDDSDDDDCDGEWLNNGTSTSKTLGGLNSGTYYWQVRADNTHGSVFANGGSAAWWQFTVLNPPTAIALTSQSALENQPAGAVVGTLSSVDADTGETFTYSLVPGDGDDDNADFTIVGDQLQTAHSLNYLTQTSHTIRVRTVDSRGASFERTFTIAVIDAPQIFADVSDTYWAAPWIERLANSGITGGCGEGNYCPDLGVTRAQMAVFLLTGIHGNDYTPP
ncbi:MAG: S-layer homology domain-containing protein, partial [Chloroflexota bacterium]